MVSIKFLMTALCTTFITSVFCAENQGFATGQYCAMPPLQQRTIEQIVKQLGNCKASDGTSLAFAYPLIAHYAISPDDVTRTAHTAKRVYRRKKRWYQIQETCACIACIFPIVGTCGMASLEPAPIWARESLQRQKDIKREKAKLKALLAGQRME